MKIRIEFLTGNRFEDGAEEIGKIIEGTVRTVDDLDEILDEIGDGVEYRVTDDDGSTFEEIVGRLLKEGGNMMKIYQMTEEALDNGMEWDDAIANGMTETVMEVDVPEGENVDGFMKENFPQYCDSDRYGWDM